MNEVSYKGYIIRPAPMQLAGGGWNHELYIVRDRRSGIAEKKFSPGTTSAGKEEAIAHCINFGKQIIDGEVANCTVEDL